MFYCLQVTALQALCGAHLNLTDLVPHFISMAAAQLTVPPATAKSFFQFLKVLGQLQMWLLSETIASPACYPWKWGWRLRDGESPAGVLLVMEASFSVFLLVSGCYCPPSLHSLFSSSSLSCVLWRMTRHKKRPHKGCFYQFSQFPIMIPYSRLFPVVLLLW